MRLALLSLVLGLAGLAAAADAPPEAIVVVVGDQHSAYERTAQFVGRIDRLQREHPGVPLAVLINGDSLEYGNAVARRTAGADGAVIGATTFGAGLPGGDGSRFAFDAGVRFDGTLWTADADGAWQARLLRRANQGPATPLAEREGENLVAAVGGETTPGRTYRLVTTDWVARNARIYLGDTPPVLTERPELKLKAAVLAALNR